MTSPLLVTLVLVVVTVVSGGPPGIYMTGNNPLKISEYWTPHGSNGATTGNVNGGQYMPQLSGTAVVSVKRPAISGTYAFYTGGYDASTKAYTATTSTYSIAEVTANQGGLMTAPRAFHGMAVLQQNGQKQQVIVCGGMTNGDAVLATCEKITFCTGTACRWTPSKNLPQGALYGLTMVSLDSQQTVYVFGGMNPNNEMNPLVFEYDVTRDTWLTKSPTGGVWNGLAYAATFTVNADQDAVTCGGIASYGGAPLKTCYLYDPQANKFNVNGALRIRRKQFAIVAFKEAELNYFAVGGSDGVEATGEVESSPNGRSWQLHEGSLVNAIQAGATVALTV